MATFPEGQWAKLVARGRKLASELSVRQWALGDLALEVQPVGPHGGAASGVQERLAQFADEIDVDQKTLSELRWVASRWPVDSRRRESSWSAHAALSSLDNRFDLVASRQWTVREARDAATAQRAHAEEAPDAPRDVNTTARFPALPSEGVDALMNVTWRSVDEILRRHVTDRRVLGALRRELMPLWSVS